ncbi:filament-like plant protein 4 isoform X1 [Mangifera indica]|uniref:filament-like plant protein 4 isoform X1 n=1 Tax=Mangifera indica TaxID=29780 RepID=UPI001CF940D9|nr:filament-like plant protein 4 isoform X1 [Mangifera indica]XP_044481293.1 filament-like plant protein 4 isoform X1 [Mangifera indica]XP_044481294.1 filament-like plant protein 4 isoform X1 [Mangifera indica]
MDRRGWPWKKKSSSEKTEKVLAASESVGTALASVGSRTNQDNYKKPTYVQISVESYSHLTGLEVQVKTYEEQIHTLEDQIKDLNEQLSIAQTEITTKDNLVKQHSKVAEEAVSGWEKAEAEALALKNHLESVTLLKLTAEDRASHLDGALKECMRQIRNLKEEHEKKLQDVVFTKTKQWDKIRLGLEAKIANLDQEIIRSEVENAELSRSLQERSNMLVKESEEKSQAEAEIELLKSNIESCEREINSAKYELHVVSKELEIRNEEKNMSMRSAEAANKQHMEGVKKIAKLEAECQRLRGLVRKKLPGPAALAQMKLEVESLGRDYGDTRLKRSPVKPPSPHLSPVTEFSLDSVQKFHKENEFLTERLLATEEETKMLKEALAKRNSELQASRNLCAKTSSKLQTLEAQLQTGSQQKSPSMSMVQIAAEGYSSQNAGNPPSFTSMSEDENDDKVSCADSWATALISEHPELKKEKNIEKLNKAENAKHLELMDDFLEMEKLACLSNDTNANDATTPPSSANKKKCEVIMNGDASGVVNTGEDFQSEQHHNMDLSQSIPESEAEQLPIVQLRSRISMLLESMSNDADMGKIVEDIKRVAEDVRGTLHQHCASCGSTDVHSSHASCNREAPGDAELSADKKIDFFQDEKPVPKAVCVTSQELLTAITYIHDFVLFLSKEVRAVHDTYSERNGLSQKIEKFSVSFNKALDSNESLVDFIFDLSLVLAKASELRINILGYKGIEVEPNSPDCIDKVALPENKVVQDSSGERYTNGCDHISIPTSDSEVLDDGNLVRGYEVKTTACPLSPEEFEVLKLEKDNMAMDLARCTEIMEMTKSQLHETEQLLTETKSQLASAQKSNTLAETQLKCMAESYRSLEMRAQELESEVNLLRAKIENVENELRAEKTSHNDALVRCKELEELLQRNECCGEADNDLKTKQEEELRAAAEKLAECQETIYLLGKQLNSLRPQPELMGSLYSQRSQRFPEDEPTSSSMRLQALDQAETDSAVSANMQRVSAESPLHAYSSPCSPSETEPNINREPINTKHLKHRPAMSTSSSSSSTATPEKQSRGFSRFFSSKGKNSN